MVTTKLVGDDFFLNLNFFMFLSYYIIWTLTATPYSTPPK